MSGSGPGWHVPPSNGTSMTDELLLLGINQSSSSEPVSELDYGCWSTITVGALLTLIVLLTVGGNLLILAAVLFNSNLRGPTHILIANLAVADLLLGFLVLPFSATLEVRTFYRTLR